MVRDFWDTLYNKPKPRGDLLVPIQKNWMENLAKPDVWFISFFDSC